MTPLVVTLALSAAAMHATWNALLRAGGDRFRHVTVMALVGLAVAAPLAVALGPPSPASYPWLAASCGLQIAYSLLLAEVYRHGELSQVYPVVRGSVPLLVTAAAYVVDRQQVGAGGIAGLACVGAGIAGLATGASRMPRRTAGLAFATALSIAAYVTADASGARLSGSPMRYATWIFLIYGLAMPAIYAAVRGGADLRVRRSEAFAGVVGGAISLLSYGAIVFALSLGPAGPISALRETSVAFAVLIGRFALGEALTIRGGGARLRPGLRWCHHHRGARVIDVSDRKDGALRRGAPPAPIASVLAVVVRGREVVLVRRANPPDAGLWGFPGGKIEGGETLTQAALRELREETGIDAEAVEVLTALDAFERDADGAVARHFVMVAVLCEWVSGEPVADDDAEAAAWFSADRLSPDQIAKSDGVLQLAERALGRS